MRVVVFGATGNCGTSLVPALARAGVAVTGVARRVPDETPPGVTWRQADITRDDLVPVVAGHDAVVHLAWLVQPSHDQATLARTNIAGSLRVAEAARAAGVPALIAASSVGAYAAGPKGEAVDETWPATGIPTSWYGRHKAELERMLDALEAREPSMRIVRVRPALVFKQAAAREVRLLFAGRLLPTPLLRRSLVRRLPDIPGLRVQAVHADDLADAYARLVLDSRAHGAYNVAAPPPLDARTIARDRGLRTMRVGRGVARAAMSATWRLRLQPSPPGWLDLALGVPLMSTARIESLGWVPRWSALEALDRLLDGLQQTDLPATPPLPIT